MDSVIRDDGATAHTTNIYTNLATFDPKTEWIWIGWYAFPETCRYSTNLLLYMKQIVEEAFVVPITLQSLTIALSGPHPLSGPHYGATRSWSGCVEAISRSTTAYAKATGAEEHGSKEDLQKQVICYTYDLFLKLDMNIDQRRAIKCLYRYIENGALSAAVTNALSKTFVVHESERIMIMDLIMDLLERLRRDRLASLDDIEPFRRSSSSSIVIE